MNIKSLVLLCTLFVCFFCACSSKDEMAKRLLKEEQELAEYITSTYGSAAINLGGGAFLVKTHEEKEGAAVEAGNYILWNWKVTNQITGELEYTSDWSHNKFPDSYVQGGPEITVVLSNKIDEGLIKMKKGEKGNVYIPSRWLFFDFQPRIFYVDIVDVISNLTIYQESLMSGYLKSLQHRGASIDTVKNVESTIDGKKYNVMYYIMEKGSGEEISEGMNIETKTSISYMIEENEVFPYVVDQELVWNTNLSGKMNTQTKTNCVGEILGKIKRGGKVVVTMPAKLYWDDKDLPKNKQTDQYYVPKWSVVVFTITVK